MTPPILPRILVAGIGNVFLGDDGFGCEVVARLLKRTQPAEVRVEDFGIRGFDLAFALMDGYDVTILVDAAPRGGKPGTLYVIEPDLDDLDQPNAQALTLETHAMNPVRVLSLAKTLGVEFKQIFLVGCEPATFGPEEDQMGLSGQVLASVDDAATLIERLIKQSLDALREKHIHREPDEDCPESGSQLDC